MLAASPDGLELRLQVAYFVNSGSEANDLALRIAHCTAPGASHVAIMAGAYHGHTKAIIDLSPYKYDGPGGEGQQPNIHVLPCPDPYRCGFDLTKAVRQPLAILVSLAAVVQQQDCTVALWALLRCWQSVWLCRPVHLSQYPALPFRGVFTL